MIKIDKNINKAKTLSSKFYTDNNIFEQSKNIFEDSIQIICSSSELIHLNTYPFTYFDGFLDENLLITKKDGDFLCLSNVCTHRGHVLAQCSNNNDVLQCKYHGRTFALDGVLKNAPGFENTSKFPSDDDNLTQVSLFNWNHFLFISFNKDSEIFNILKQIDKILPDFPYSDLSKAPIRNEYLLDCHWALYCDNYLEGFHIPYVHKGLNDDIDWKNYKTEILDQIVLQKVRSKNLNDSIEYDSGGDMYAYYFFIFPNIMINYYKWGISINVIEPISKDKTRIKYMIYNLKGQSIPKKSSSSVDMVESEDQEVVLSVQKGIKSRFYKSGQFSPSMEKGVHYFHRLISKKIFNFNQ